MLPFRNTLQLAASAFIIFSIAQFGFAKDVNYTSNGKTVRLIQVPGQYVVGLSGAADSQGMIPNVIKTRSLGRGMIVIDTGSSLEPSSLSDFRSLDSVDFIYPVYRYAGSTLRVYPRPEVIVQIADGADARQITAQHELDIVRNMLFTEDQFVLRMDASRSPFTVSDRLRNDPGIVWADPNAARQIQKRFKPNDPLYPQQWHLNNTGQNDGQAGADISAEAAWDLQMPKAETVIAVVDDAVDTDHPDLNIYTNPIEAAGSPGVDDDGNGLVDDIHGWDFGSNDNDPKPDNEENAHGTSVAGVAAAIGNNGIGCVGASFGSAILPVKISFGEEGEEEPTEEEELAIEASIADAIRYAARYADVMNNSWGGTEMSDAVSSALDFAASDQSKRGGKGVPVLFASGNDASWFYRFESDEIFPPGPYTIEVVYEKDGSGSAGSDSVLVLDVFFMSDETGDLIDDLYISPSSTTFPDGVSGTGDAPFHIIPSDLSEYGFVYKSGSIGNNQSTSLIWDVNLSQEGIIVVKFRYSTEAGKDKFSIFVDGERLTGGVLIGEEDYMEAPFSGETPHNITPLAGENLHPKVINIGSSNDRDVRSLYSQWGPEIDFLAPSDGNQGINQSITTTDASAPGFGYDPDSAYAEDFGGTSSASPLAAGVVALVLTANPELSVAELIDVLKTTSRKIGDLPYDTNGFNEQYGYGRLDMAAAVQRALDLKGTHISTWELY